MTFQKLIFLCVKNTIYQDESSFTFSNFQSSEDGNTNEWSSHIDYARFIQNAFMPINEAIARLSDLNKIPYKIDVAKVDDNGIIDLTKNKDGSDINVKDVISIATKNYKIVNSLPFGMGNHRIINYNPNTDYYIEYREDIPYLDYNIATDRSIELKNYGINDSMCNYIIEYASAKLYEQIDISVSNMHLSRAEQYFYAIRDVKSSFRVTSVTLVNRIEV